MQPARGCLAGTHEQQIPVTNIFHHQMLTISLMIPYQGCTFSNVDDITIRDVLQLDILISVVVNFCKFYHFTISKKTSNPDFSKKGHTNMFINRLSGKSVPIYISLH